jgi:iron-sulfur cluster repair protein YtfE (RIC family)
MGPLNDAGIDTCCGGAASLRDAASDAGVPLASLTTTLARVLASRGA